MSWKGSGMYEDELRRFELVRTEDNTGVSGTGVVVCGVEYPDGSVHMMWMNEDNDDIDIDVNATAWKNGPNGIEQVRRVHGHGGRTKIRWLDE